MEERLRQRHSTNNKFAKKLKRFEMMNDSGVRESYNEMMREKNQLKSRTKKVNQVERDEDSEDYGSESDEDLDEEGLREKAIRKIEEELESDEEDSD